jgi:hypothetical protein
LIVGVGLFVFFLIESFRLQEKLYLGLVAFIGYVAVGGICGFGLAFLSVVVLTVVTDSHQAPLALLLYGPLAMALGEVVGAATWRRNALRPTPSRLSRR